MESSENEQLKRMLGPTAACPALERLLEGNLSSHDQTHVSECGHCTTELALYRSFEDAAPSPEEAEPIQWMVSRLAKSAPRASSIVQSSAAADPWWKTWWSPRALAPASLAMASVLVAVAIVQFNRHVETPAEIHVSATDTMRSQSLEVSAPVGQIAEIPKTLNWIPVTAAATYSVRVMEVDRTVLWKTNVTASSVVLPDRVLASIVPHKRILWDVTALDAQGKHLAASGAKDFVLNSK